MGKYCIKSWKIAVKKLLKTRQIFCAWKLEVLVYDLIPGIDSYGRLVSNLIKY